jgi:hypothetical protein
VLEGCITKHDGLVVELDTHVKLDPLKTYYIWLQYKNATVGSIRVSQQIASNKLVLSSIPQHELVTDINSYTRTTFKLTTDGGDIIPYIVVDKSPADNGIVAIKAINYTDKYYLND